MGMSISTVALDTCGSCSPWRGRGTHRLPHRPTRPKAAGCACGSGHVGERHAVTALAFAAPGQPFSEGIGFGFLPLGLGHAGHQ